MTNPFGNDPRAQAAPHEAGHAVVGALLYGTGFVGKIRMKDRTHGYAETETSIATMWHQPKNTWNGSSVVPVQQPANQKQQILAFATQAMAGMAAEALAFGGFTPAKNDITAINDILHQLKLPHLALNDPDLAEKLKTTYPYRDGLLAAHQILEHHRPQFDPVAAWLKKTDTLQGHEVEDLMAGKTIRAPGI